MRKSIFTLVTIILCLFTLTVKADHIDETYDWKSDEHYQNIATDFRTYTVCEAVHNNLALIVSLHYGVSENLGFQTSYLQRIEEMLSNTTNLEKHFASETLNPVKLLMEQYHVPAIGLQRQAIKNQNIQKQGMSMAFARSNNNPNQMTIIIKKLLDQSKLCRNHESKVDYSSLD